MASALPIVKGGAKENFAVGAFLLLMLRAGSGPAPQGAGRAAAAAIAPAPDARGQGDRGAAHLRADGVCGTPLR